MEVNLSLVHYTYIISIIAIIIFMVRKKSVSMICILGIFLVGLVSTASVVKGISGIFSGFIFAINELSGTILIISVVTALCKLLELTGVNERMVAPLTKFIKNPTTAYWIIGIVMFVISTFFWPSPAVALIGAVFLPVALKAKLPAMGVAVAMNLFGHGIALSGDFVIQGAPKLAADGAGVELSSQLSASIPLVIVMGAVTTVCAYLFLMKDIQTGKLTINNEEAEEEGEKGSFRLNEKWIKIFSVLVPLCFIADIILMLTLNLQGGDATALIGGTSLLLLIIISIAAFKNKSFEEITDKLVEGFTFGFRVFGPVIPIAAFFFLGDSALAAVFGEEAVPANSAGLVNDLGLALSSIVPIDKGISAVTVTAVGVITGLDGSGFSGLNLVGSVSRIFAVAIGKGGATLSALGQITTIWVGGGTVIPWAVIPVAAICGVSPIELAGRNIKPVAIGLLAATAAAILLM